MGEKQNSLSVFTLDFCDRPGRASALAWGVFAGHGAPLKFVGDRRIQVAANCIGDLRDVSAAGRIPLLGPDGHLQNLALAVRIGAAFREVLCRRFRPGPNFPGFLAVRHKSPRFKNEMAWAGAGWRQNRELTDHSEPNWNSKTSPPFGGQRRNCGSRHLEN